MKYFLLFLTKLLKFFYKSLNDHFNFALYESKKLGFTNTGSPRIWILSLFLSTPLVQGDTSQVKIWFWNFFLIIFFYDIIYSYEDKCRHQKMKFIFIHKDISIPVILNRHNTNRQNFQCCQPKLNYAKDLI